ncbi:MAG: hypothetical protein D6734_07220 [Candidatus Schekmanbacteria bacterium]|nr:MAG: hypothetical protein D6734_07220 [Candidatus Schekmanbacteria bacterium]
MQKVESLFLIYIFVFFSFFTLFVSNGESGEVPSNVIADVGGRKITIDEIDSIIKLLPEDLQVRYLNKKLKRDFIRDYIETELLYLEGKEKGIEKDREFLLRKKSIERALIRDIYIKKYVAKNLSVSENDVVDYYNKHKSDFKHSDYAFASHILLRSQEEAEKVRKLLDEGKISFKDAVKRYSIDKKTIQKDGKLGLIHENEPLKGYRDSLELVKNIFSMKPNEIGGPFKSGEGYHIVFLKEIKKGRPKSLDEVRGEIEMILDKEETVKKIENEIARLKKKYKVKIYKENF